MKSVTAIKKTSSNFPKCLSFNGSTFTYQVETSNIFNNYFASISEKKRNYQLLTQTFF